ncbi:uncharacterized protein LOC118433057 [Folsomia candida]|uniref:uncharacterized protein LOC118433057 n=1 Tax=Folsomia candida TaxID=158441 RepID=UPI001604D58C|nr:uncharacterized protein LOC118433057 [Folsomia candida]
MSTVQGGDNVNFDGLKLPEASITFLSFFAIKSVISSSNFGIAVHEEVADETFLRHMTQIGKPWNAFELLGINDQFGLPLDSHVTKGAILTPELVRRFIHLPHVENLLFDFVLILSPDHPDDQDKNEEFLTEQIHRLKDRFHHLNTVCNKTPGIMEARFVDIIEPQEGSFGYSITISIDRQTFNGLLP